VQAEMDKAGRGHRDSGDGGELAWWAGRSRERDFGTLDAKRIIAARRAGSCRLG